GTRRVDGRVRVLGVQGRRDRVLQGARARGRPARDHRERRLPRPGEHDAPPRAHGRGARREHPRGLAAGDSHAPPRRARGRGRRSRVLRVRGGGLRDGPGAERIRWAHDGRVTETPPPRPSGAGETALAVLLLALAAALPFVHALDLAVAPWVEAVRTCAGQRLFVGVSAWTRPVGFGLLVLVLGVRLARGASARAVVPTALAALLAGTLLVDVMKGAVDRPRPDAENLSWVGGAYPSGHVGNTVLCALVVVCLWRGAVGRRFGAGWLLALGAAVVVGTARVYTEHHSTCDVVGTTALVSGFAVLALAHPRPWVRA